MNANGAIGKIKFMLDVGGSNGFTSADKEALNLAINALSAGITAPPKSNGDKIRSMTDEELADKLTDKCAVCVYHYAECETKFCICEEGVLEWLKQEVSEDAGTD